MPINHPAGGNGITGPLSIGSRGPDVRILQEALNRTNPLQGLQADGVFGVRTDAAVRAFQSANHLRPDGIVGPLTAAALGLRYTARPNALPTTPADHSHFESPQSPLHVTVPPVPLPANAVEVLANAVIQGMTNVQNRVLNILIALDVPEAVISQIRSHLAGPFQSVAGLLRSVAHTVGSSAAATILSAAVRQAIDGVTNALEVVVGVLQRLPDLLGLGTVVDRIRSIISRLRGTINAVIDVIVRTLSGMGRSLIDAASAIITILTAAAA